jgi:2,4-didehydro-3-deoxy-L-rhamnonate hydrolase
MKFYTFETNTGGGNATYGVQFEQRLLDLPVAARFLRGLAVGDHVHQFPKDLFTLVAAGTTHLPSVAQLLDAAMQDNTTPGLWHPLESVRVRAPLPRPGKVICSGINYHGHLQENPNATLPDSPFFFAKMNTAIIGPNDSIVLPPLSQQVDYEVEMAVVIGKRLHRCTEVEVPGAIFGYTILHDVSARDVQFKDQQITLGKNFDTFCPMGPCIVTSDELPHPQKLSLSTRLNGEVVQDGSNEDWVFRLPQLLSSLSAVMTLEPGDVVSTGTPRGVGFFRSPQLFLKHGDTVTLEISGIGRLQNPVVRA